MKNLFFSGLLLIASFSQHAVFSQSQRKSDLLTFEQFDEKFKAAGTNAQILDARSPEEYGQNHLERAVNFNTTDKTDFEKESAKLDKSKPVFIYAIANTRSIILAKELTNAGFNDVTVIPGGLSKWIGLGRPVVSTVGKGLSAQQYSAVVKDDKLVLVNFGSRYCGSCKKLAPAVDSIKNEYSSSLKVVKIEAYENKELTKELGVVELPTLILYKNNKVVWQKSGVTPKPEIEKVLRGQTL